MIDSLAIFVSISLRVGSGLMGLLLIYAAMRSALITFVLPRSAPETISRFWFRLLRRLFDWRVRHAKEYRHGAERQGEGRYAQEVGKRGHACSPLLATKTTHSCASFSASPSHAG